MNNRKTVTNKLIRYDRERQRVWVAGWRLHHGVTGIVLAALGSALVAHDWKDRSIWLRDPSKTL